MELLKTFKNFIYKVNRKSLILLLAAELKDEGLLGKNIPKIILQCFVQEKIDIGQRLILEDIENEYSCICDVLGLSKAAQEEFKRDSIAYALKGKNEFVKK